MTTLQVGRVRYTATFVALVILGAVAILIDIKVLNGYSVERNTLVISSETPQGTKETSFESTLETEARFETESGTEMRSEDTLESEPGFESESDTEMRSEGSLEREKIIQSVPEAGARNDNTEKTSQNTVRSNGSQGDYHHSEKQLMQRKLETYNSLIEIQQSRATQSPGSSQQVRHTIQQLPKLIDGTSYYAIDARLDAVKQRVVIDFAQPYKARVQNKDFRLPLYRRVSPIELSTGNKHAKYYIRDCRVRSLLTGEMFGDETYLSAIEDDETSMYWQGNRLNSTDHNVAPMKPCGTCTWHIFANKDMRFNGRRLFQVHCSVWDWVSDLLREHAGTGVFQFDLGIQDKGDKARTFKAGDLERSMGRPDVWPTLPGIALDIPLTSYSHHSFRDSEFRGDPVKLDEDRNGTIAACITVSAANSRLLLTHADQLLLHGVDHIFYLPMMKSAYGVDEHSPDLRTDPEEYFEQYLQMQNVLANRKGFVTFSKPWLFPMFDVSSAQMQIFGVNSCYGHAMNMGFDWVFVLDVDEFLTPDYTTPLDIPVSNLTSPPPVATGVKPKAKPWLQRILEAYDPTKLCELRIERFRYKAKHKVPEKNNHWLPENMLSITIGRTALSPMRRELDGKSILGRNVLLTGVHQGYCADDSLEDLTVPLSQGVLIHSSDVFGMDFNEGT